MMTEHLREVMDQLAAQPEDVQEKYATELEMELEMELEPDRAEQQRIAAQLADPRETDLAQLLDEADRQIAAGEVYDLYQCSSGVKG